MAWPPPNYPLDVNKTNLLAQINDHPDHHNALAETANDTVGEVNALRARASTIEATGWVTTTRLADGAVTNSKLGADAVTSAKLADNSVNSEHYVDGSIDTVHIANGAITVSKMAANSVDSAQYVDGSIDTSHLANNSVTAAKMDTEDDNKLPAGGVVRMRRIGNMVFVEGRGVAGGISGGALTIPASMRPSGLVRFLNFDSSGSTTGTSFVNSNGSFDFQPGFFHGSYGV